MKTILTSLALVAGATVFAQNTVAPTPQPEAAPYVQSMYDECLLTSGTASWKALKLNDDQMARITDLQTRYKQSAQAAKDKALADEKAAAKKSKGKKGTSSASATVKKEAAASTTTRSDEQPQMAADKAMPIEGTLDKDADISAANPEGMQDLSLAPVDAELRSILTPEQLVVWEKRCDAHASVHP